MRRIKITILVLGFVLIGTSTALAASSQSHSSNFEVNEVQFGPGGLNSASSTNYKAQESAGSTAVGGVAGSADAANSGFLTPNEPFLQMTVSTSSINLGTLSSTSASTGTAAFSIRAYVDSGYTVESLNAPPADSEGHVINKMSTAAVSTAGTEQYGINLVQNLTSCAHPAPVNFGANPVLVPNSTYASGAAATGYNTCGLFKYNVGDVIAQSTSSGWGETDYTISYLININSLSPAGRYTMNQDLVVVATY
jgi:hypothetical protein